MPVQFSREAAQLRETPTAAPQRAARRDGGTRFRAQRLLSPGLGHGVEQGSCRQNFIYFIEKRPPRIRLR